MKAKRRRVPPPGLQGTYEGSCLTCYQGCDTVLAFRGQAHFIAACLLRLGIPDGAEAVAIVGYGCGYAPACCQRVP